MPIVVGTSGADILVGGNSDNQITGGAGNDIFVYQRFSTDTQVRDFGTVYFAASMTGQQETPPNLSVGSGVFTGALNRARTSFDFTATVTGVDLGIQTQGTADNIVAAHFHAGPPGTAGGIVFGFLGTPNNDIDNTTTANPTTGVVTSEWHLNEGNNTTLTAQLPNLLSNNLYINFHSVALPGGEIRGQVTVQDTGADRIDLRDVHIGDMETLLFVTKALGLSSVISTTFNGSVSNMMLQGVTLGSLTAADFIFADAAPTTITGTAGNDDLFGSTGVDTISAGDGADRLFGGGASDLIDAGLGNDTVYGQAGDDSLAGGGGNDSIQGNTGADTAMGGDGNDFIAAGKGNDTVFGEAGNDTLSGDTGNDNLFGGAGADRFVMRAGFGADWAVDFSFAEGDRVQLSAGVTFTTSAFQNQTILTLSTGDTLGLAGVPLTSFTNDYVVFG